MPQIKQYLENEIYELSADIRAYPYDSWDAHVAHIKATWCEYILDEYSVSKENALAYIESTLDKLGGHKDGDGMLGVESQVIEGVLKWAYNVIADA